MFNRIKGLHYTKHPYKTWGGYGDWEIQFEGARICFKQITVIDFDLTVYY